MIEPPDPPLDPERKKRLALRQAAYMAQKANAADTTKRTAVRFASDCGASLREISEVTRIPHMTVKRILDRTP